MHKAAEDPESLTLGQKALVFSICFITSLSFSDEECESMFLVAERFSLLDDLQLSVEAALLDADYTITSDLLVLQAFILYLVSMLLMPCQSDVLIQCQANNAKSGEAYSAFLLDGHCLTCSSAPRSPQRWQPSGPATCSSGGETTNLVATAAHRAIGLSACRVHTINAIFGLGC